MNRYISGIDQKTLYALFAGAIAALAFSPFEIFPIAILSIALLIYLWLHCSPRSAFIFGYIYGIGFFGFGVSWLHISINLFGGINIAGAVFITFLLVAFLAVYPALCGLAWKSLHVDKYPLVSIIIGVPALWTLSEWLRSWIFTGLPWLNLGYSQTDSLLNGLAPLTGVFGITLAVVLTAASLVALLSADTTRRVLICAVLTLVWGGSWIASKYEWTDKTGETLSVALIQGSVPQELKWAPEMRQPTMQLYAELSGPYLGHDLIIWPEAAIPAYYHQLEDFMVGLQELTRQNNSNLLTGMPVYDRGSDKYYNSVVLLGEDISFYYKRHLVPFGEYLPLRPVLGKLVDYFGIPMADFSQGPATPPLLTANNFKLGISICYEDTFGHEVIQALPEAGLLVNVSNDAWFGDSAAPHQHMQMARMRALETGRFMVRSTNTGVSAFINQKGKIISQLPQFVPGALDAEVVLFEGHTPYSRAGNYPVIIFSVLVVAGLLLLARIKPAPTG